MPDDDQLSLSGGGTTTIATDVMLADAQVLDLVHLELNGIVADLQIAAAVGEPLDDLERAMVIARSARDQSGTLCAAVEQAMERYSAAEAWAKDLAVDSGAMLGFAGGAVVGASLRVLLGPLGLPILGLTLPWLVRDLTASETPIGPDDITMPDDVTRILTDPNVVDALRIGTSSMDEAIMGFGGSPAMAEAMLAAAGITGVSATACLLTAFGSTAGLFAETPVAVTRTQTGAAALTNGVDGRLGRIPLPESAPGGAQIRIDTITSATDPPRFEVYIGGTVDFRALPADDAFDLTSNVAGVGGLPAGGIRAVRQAMLDAGIAPDSQVTFTGYSQGGMVAAALAASGDYNVQGVVTVAAPAGNVQLPAGIPALIIEHTDDFIPALGGVQTNTEALVVRREAFAANDEPTGLAAPAHRMPYYRETAVLMDQARSEQLVDARHQLDAFSAGAESIVSTYYYAGRQP